MRRRLLVLSAFLALISVNQGLAQSESQTLIINADQGEITINRHIYGHFAEHLGRGIYDGFWIQSETGEYELNRDIVEALREIEIPNLRWPGGCFADYYFWKDGIGPRSERPTIVNNLWGGVTEDNSFGTHEFMNLVEELETEPIIVGNVGSGTVREMAQWWEYMNHPGVSPMADLRRENGREEPWDVRFWGVGNESWGCGGNMTPQHYADEFKRFGTYLQNYGDVTPFRIAAGAPGDDYEWTEVLMREAAGQMDGIDLHHYTITGTWAQKGYATDFTEAEWFELMENTLYWDEILTRHSAVMDQYDPENRIWLIAGEWGTWHTSEEGSTPGFLYQQNALRDAISAAVTLNIFNTHAERVRMANIAQTINVLQAMILTDGEDMLLTPTYHVFDFYKVHHDATLLPIHFEPGEYELDGQSIDAVSVSASEDSDGRIHITLANMDPHNSKSVSTVLRGAEVSEVTGRILTAEAMNAHNTFEQPEHVSPGIFNGAALSDSGLTVELPAKSVVVLELQ